MLVIEVDTSTRIGSPEVGSPAAMGFGVMNGVRRSEEHTSELQSRFDLVCRLLLENKTLPPSTIFLTHSTPPIIYTLSLTTLFRSHGLRATTDAPGSRLPARICCCA